MARIQQIEKDMLRIRQHLQAQTAESEVGIKCLHVNGRMNLRSVL